MKHNWKCYCYFLTYTHDHLSALWILPPEPLLRTGCGGHGNYPGKPWGSATEQHLVYFPLTHVGAVEKREPCLSLPITLRSPEAQAGFPLWFAYAWEEWEGPRHSEDWRWNATRQSEISKDELQVNCVFRAISVFTKTRKFSFPILLSMPFWLRTKKKPKTQ